MGRLPYEPLLDYLSVKKKIQKPRVPQVRVGKHTIGCSYSLDELLLIYEEQTSLQRTRSSIKIEVTKKKKLPRTIYGVEKKIYNPRTGTTINKIQRPLFKNYKSEDKMKML